MPRSDDEDDYDRPRRRRDRDDYDDPRRDEYDDRPRGPQGNGLATAGLILGVLSFCTAGLTGIPGVICSAIGLGKPVGRGKAMAGLVLSLVGTLVGIGLWGWLLFEGMRSVREAAARVKDGNNLKQIGLGAHNYHDFIGTLPPADGGLSWRVHILPYIEQENLYRQFNLNQPWDSATNKPLAGRQIPTYLAVEDMQKGSADTRYRVFVGPDTLYDPDKKIQRLVDVTDGTSNTFFAVEAADTVPWSQPKELRYDRGAPLPPLGVPSRNVFQVVFLDASVRAVSKNVSPDMIRNGIEPTNGKGFKID